MLNFYDDVSIFLNCTFAIFMVVIKKIEKGTYFLHLKMLVLLMSKCTIVFVQYIDI